MRAGRRATTLHGMTDGKLDALRRDPVLRDLRPAQLLWVGRVVDLLDVVAGELVAAADRPACWGFYGRAARLHVLRDGAVLAPAAAPLLLLPDDLDGAAVVAAAPCRLVAFPRTAVGSLLQVAPRLAQVPRHPELLATTGGGR